MSNDAADYSPWVFRARPDGVTDGDTIDVTVDCGFQIRREIKLRLKGVDTAEIHFVAHDSEEYQTGIEQTEFVKEWLATATDEADSEWPLLVHTEQKGKYGRYLATVRRRCDGAELTAALFEEYGDSVDY